MFPNGVVVAQQTLTLLVVGSIPLSGAILKHISAEKVHVGGIPRFVILVCFNMGV